MNSLIITNGILRRMLREKSAIGFILVIPILAGLMLVSLNPGSRPVKPVVGVANLDRGAAGASLLEGLRQHQAYQMQTMPEDKIASAVTSGRVTAGIIVPPDFTAGLTAGGNIRVAVYLRETNPIGDELNVWLSHRLAIMRIAAAVDPAAGAAPVGPPSVSDRFLAELAQNKVAVAVSENQKAGGDFIGQLGLGFLIMILMLFGGTMTGTILEDKRNKTFMRTFSAPLLEYELVLGNLLAYFVLGMLQIIASLLIITFIFRVSWGTSVLNVFLILGAFLITSLGLSIGITGFVSNHEQFMVVNNLIVSPTCILGGCFIPLQLMPAGIRLAANLVPQKWAIEALQKLHQGATLGAVSSNLLILLLFGLVFFTFGVKTLKPGVEDL